MSNIELPVEERGDGSFSELFSNMSEDEKDYIIGKMEFGNMRSWFQERGYDINLSFYYPSLGNHGNKLKCIKKAFEIVDRIGPENLTGKSLELIPNTSDVGYTDHPVSGYGKQFTLGLDAQVDELVEAIEKYIVKQQ